MTLLECFTISHIDNIAACLRLRPDRMVMIGNASEMGDSINRYRQLLKQRNITTEITVCAVQNKDLCGVYTALREEILQSADCVIDLTGGDECVFLAIGAILAALSPDARQRISIVKFDHNTNTVRNCLQNNDEVQTDTVNVTVEELIALHGGTLHPDSYQPPSDSTPQDLAGLWDIVSDAPKDWNRSITQLNEFESRSDSKMQVFLPLEYIRDRIPNFRMKEEALRAFLDKLQRKGIIYDQSSRYALEYTYNSQLLRYCTLKAGNVLEIKTLLEGRAVQENGMPYFHDCRTSVGIDWDGIVYHPVDHIPETRNEIDVVLMRGTTPLFVSCKNGNIVEEELYKLHTVAERFGGPYARKMLIATNWDQKDPPANRAFIQRARDMNILLVTDADELSKEEWQALFINAMR